MRRGAGRACAAALTALTVLLLYPALLQGRIFYERDVHLLWWGRANAFVAAVRSGVLPLWDPLLGLGIPFLADGTRQALYPPTWLNVLVSPPSFYTLYIASHLLFAGAGCFLLARRFALSQAAALGSAALYMSSGPLLSLVNVLNHFAGACWLPWEWLACEVALRTRSRTAALLWGGSAALGFLAGSPEMAFAAAAIALARTSGAVWRARGLAPLGVAALAGTVAIALSAGQWAPTLDVLRRSERAHQTMEDLDAWSVSRGGAAQALLPLWTHGALPPEAAPLFGDREPYLRSLYLGLPAAALVGAAAASRRRRLALLLAGLGTGAALLALGPAGGVYAAVARVLPVLAWFRYPVKFMAAAALCWALVAGVGLDAVRRRVGARAAAAAVLLAVGAGALLLGGRVPPEALAAAARAAAVTLVLAVAAVGAAFVRGPAAAAAMALLAVADLALWHVPLNPTAPRALYAYRPPLLDRIVADGGTRLYVVDYSAVPGAAGALLGHASAYRVPIRPGVAAPEPWLEALALREYLLPPIPERWGMAGSYDRDVVRLQPAAVSALTEALWAAHGTPSYTRLLQVAGVTHVVSLHPLAGLPEVAALPGPFEGPIRLFRVPSPLPEAYVVERARAAPGHEVEALLEPAFDPAREAIVDGDALAGAPGVRPAAVLDRRPGRLSVESTSAAAGYVVALQAFEPGWRAWVDGAPAPVRRVNAAFCGVRVGAGRHVVTLAYRPRAAMIGLSVSAGAALLVAAALAAAGLRGRRAPALS